MARKETLHIVRDPRTLLWAFGLPVLLLILFGYAISLDVNHIGTLIVDPAPSPTSRLIRDTLQGSGYFNITMAHPSTKPIEEAFLRDKARVALIFPVDFGDKIARRENAPVQIIADGADNNTALIALGYLQRVILEHNAEVTLQTAVRAGKHKLVTPISVSTRVWYNEELRSRVFIVPGLIALILGMMAVILTSLCVAREFERGTFEQLVATPLTRGEFLAGKMAPYYAIGLIDLAISLLASRFLFDVAIKGSLINIFIVCGVFLLAGLGQGLVISIVAQTQQVAMQAGILSSLLPSLILSGFMFPISSMPPLIRVITNIVPARHLLEALRGIMLKGVPLWLVWPQLVFLTVVALLFLAVSLKRFRKRLD